MVQTLDIHLTVAQVVFIDLISMYIGTYIMIRTVIITLL